MKVLIYQALCPRCRHWMPQHTTRYPGDDYAVFGRCNACGYRTYLPESLGNPSPVWSRVDLEDTTSHTCIGKFSSPVPNDQDFNWPWYYVTETIGQQLGLDPDSLEPAEYDPFEIDEDGDVLSVFIMLEGQECRACDAEDEAAEERQREMEYCRGEQVAMF